MLLSVVVPVFNEEELISSSCDRLLSALSPLEQNGDSFELIFVDDGCRDKSAQILADKAKGDARIKLISFARNFGHQIAITAGMDFAEGDAVVTIDADMQDPPEVILEMVDKWREGYEIVYGRHRKRAGETFFKKFTAAAFYRLLNSLTTIEFPVDTGDFRLFDRKVCLAMRDLPERNRYVRGLMVWVGYRQVAVEFDRAARMAGETKYPLKKMLKLATDGILSFSASPLRALWKTGLWFAAIGFLGILATTLPLQLKIPLMLPFLSIGAFFSGIILIGLGILGAYISRMMDEVRNRPQYIVREKIGF